MFRDFMVHNDRTCILEDGLSVSLIGHEEKFIISLILVTLMEWAEMMLLRGMCQAPVTKVLCPHFYDPLG